MRGILIRVYTPGTAQGYNREEVTSRGFNVALVGFIETYLPSRGRVVIDDTILGSFSLDLKK